MASFKTTTLLLLFMMYISLCHFQASCFEFQVGGTTTNGWAIPPSNDSKVYNDWASENRFRVGDTLRFKYKKDSVMEVNEEDYKKCNSTHPNFFSNTGNSVFRFDNAGPFYFISGVSGHCERGQKMIVKVMNPEDSSATSHSRAYSKLLIFPFVLSYVSSIVF